MPKTEYEPMLKSENLEGYKIAFSREITQRTLKAAEHMQATHETIRQIAEKFGCSKSTIHKDLSYRLPHIDEQLYKEIKVILDEHFEEKYMRGVEARRRYAAESTNS